MTSRLSHLKHVLGFDTTENIPFSTRYRISCSQCRPSVVMGTPTHERACPNETSECNGCGNRIRPPQRYCQECVS